MKHGENIDGLRTIAVLAVMIFHLGFLPMNWKIDRYKSQTFDLEVKI